MFGSALYYGAYPVYPFTPTLSIAYKARQISHAYIPFTCIKLNTISL
jgi:hypothetical protein